MNIFLADGSANALNQFLTGAWSVLARLLIGIIGIVTGFVFYVKAKKEKRPRYAMRSLSYFQGLTTHVPFLKIHFEGHGDPITTLTRTTVLFWNAGKETINKPDVVDTDPLQIKAIDCEILDARIVGASHPPNQFGVLVNREKTNVTITFKYIDKNQGAGIQIFYTGASERSLSLTGSIKGASIERIVETKWEPYKQIFSAGFGAGTSLAIASAIAAGQILATIIAVALLVVMGWCAYWLADRLFVRIPRRLRDLYHEAAPNVYNNPLFGVGISRTN